MGNFILLIFCFGAGILLRHFRTSPDNTPAVLNAFIINIGLPAMALGYLNTIELKKELFIIIAAPWAMFIIALFLLWPACKLMRFPAATTGCVILVGGLANTSFIGIPMIEAFYGTSFVSLGIVIDQLGSYLILALLGIAVARIFSGGASASLGDIASRIVKFPPFVATIAALLLNGVTYPEWLETLFTRLAATVAPLALVSVGFQLRLSEVSGKITPLIVGLLYKLVVGPLLVLVLFVTFLDARGVILQVTIFELAMAPMIGASIVAMNNDLDPSLATLLVAIGVPLSFLSLIVWHQALAGI